MHESETELLPEANGFDSNLNSLYFKSHRKPSSLREQRHGTREVSPPTSYLCSWDLPTVMSMNTRKSRAGNQIEPGQKKRFTRTCIRCYSPAKKKEIFLNDIHNKAILTIVAWFFLGGGSVILTLDLCSHKSLRNENQVYHHCLLYTDTLPLFKLV